jgi:NAD(P)-dependent dehydrogenase (short-subunit alcohol dehydrogenase family)
MTRQYVADGWSIHACCRNPAEADDLAALSQANPGKITLHKLDVDVPDQIEALGQEMRGEAIDILLNNAGILGAKIDAPGGAGLGDIDYDGWADVLRINTIAPMRLTEALVEPLARSEMKLVVFMSSHMGSITDLVDSGFYAYRSSKAAVNMVVKLLSIDLKDKGIRTLSVHPGWVRTDMGGSTAPVGIEESITGLRKVIADYRADQTGCFYRFDGVELPW